MQTQLKKASPKVIEEAAALLLSGELCAFPTETVYGLGANALADAAVEKIFSAKGRPSDNPLIVHVSDKQQALALWSRITKTAEILMEAFWPGALTLILPKSDTVSKWVTAGLDTVAVRCPANDIALSLISASCPLAAPSANKSGRPSPTSAQHVYDDLNGGIPLIIDGGPCRVGIESTVIDVRSHPVLLRPGGVALENIQSVLGYEITISPGVDKMLLQGETARSPGLLYKHYAPNAKVIVIEGGQAIQSAVLLYEIKKKMGENPVILALSNIIEEYPDKRSYFWSFGKTLEDAASSLYSLLRNADTQCVTAIIIPTLGTEYAGRGVMNRINRAAGFYTVNGDELLRGGGKTI